MKTNFANWLGVIGFVTLMVISFTWCEREKKFNDRFSTEGSTLKENKNENQSYSTEKDSTSYQTSCFQYNNRMKTTNAEDEYNDRLDDYLDDTEDELQFDPSTFDFQDE